jgi:hypothetical protein
MLLIVRLFATRIVGLKLFRQFFRPPCNKKEYICVHSGKNQAQNPPHCMKRVSLLFVAVILTATLAAQGNGNRWRQF